MYLFYKQTYGHLPKYLLNNQLLYDRAGLLKLKLIQYILCLLTTFLPFLTTAVVWNPWDRKAKAMPDFGDDDYKHMLSVEAAAIEKPIILKPGEEWKGRIELSAVPSSYCSGQLDPQKVLQG